MLMLYKNKKKASQYGFTLLEMLLAVGAASVLLIAFTGLLQNVARDELSISAAEHLKKVGKAVDAVLAVPEYFDAIYQRTDDVGFTANDLYEMPLNDLITGINFGGGVVLEASSVLGQNFDINNPLKTDISIIFRVADTNNIRALEYYIVTDEAKIKDTVVLASQQIGGRGGYYYDDPLYAANDPIQGTYGIWRADFADLAGTGWHTDVTAAGLDDETAYLVYYNYVNEEDVIGDYLYRTPQFTRPDLHIMNSDLDLASYNLLGVDNVYLSGDLTLEQDMIVQGALYVAGNATIDGEFSVDGRMEAQNITMGNTTFTPVTRTTYNIGASELYIQNDLLITQAINVGDIKADVVNVEELNAQNIQASTVVMNAGDLTVESSAGVATAILNTAGGGGVFSNLNLANETRASTLNLSNNGADAFVNTGGKTGIILMDQPGNMNVTGTLVVPEINNNTVDIDQMGACDDGCTQEF